MAVPLTLLSLFSLTVISTHFTTIHGAFTHQSHIKLPSQELTHLHFYYHDILKGKNPSVVQIVEAPKNTPRGFGTTFMMDNYLTEGPELSSKHVGRAQGLFGQASLRDVEMVMLINFVFTDGIYAGSTLSLLGRNPVLEQDREMPIVGGTGAFRFATGYALAHSVFSISTDEHFIVEYNITLRLP